MNHSMRMFAAMAASLLAMALAPFASAQPRDDGRLLRLLRTTSAPVIYASPADLPRFGYSYAVVINNWTDVVKLPRMYSQDGKGSFKEQTAGALRALDQQLQKLDVTKGRIVRLHVLIKGGTFKQTLEVTDVLDTYFADRVLQKSSMPEAFDQPTRNIDGVKEIDGANPNRLVALDVTILDPKTASTEKINDIAIGRVKSQPLRADRSRRFFIDAVSAQRTDFKFDGTGAEQIPHALKNLDLILKTIGASKENVRELEAIFVPEEGVKRSDLERALQGYLGQSAAKINFRPVQMSGIPGGTVCFSAMGSVVYPEP